MVMDHILYMIYQHFITVFVTGVNTFGFQYGQRFISYNALFSLSFYF